MLNIGIIGAGHVVQSTHAPAIASRKDVCVAGIADPHRDNCRQLGRKLHCNQFFADYRDLLKRDDIDAVDICLPHAMHERAVLAALHAGKDVMLEKPIALNLEQADNMIHAARQCSRKFYVILNQRFFPAHRKMKEILAGDQYGSPFMAVCHVFGDEYARMNVKAHWKGTWDIAGGGALMDTGTHVVDLFLWWFGRPRSVACQWGKFLVQPRNKADDNVVVTLEYDGMLANIVLSYTVASDAWTEDKHIFFRRHSCHVYPGSREPLMMGTDKHAHMAVPVDAMQDWWEESEYAAVHHFLDCFTRKAEPDYGPEAARDALELILLAYQAAEAKRHLVVSPD